MCTREGVGQGADVEREGIVTAGMMDPEVGMLLSAGLVHSHK